MTPAQHRVVDGLTVAALAIFVATLGATAGALIVWLIAVFH
jgi:hypothetical protein